MPRFDDHFLNEIRDKVPISEIVGRYVTWDRKKTQSARGDWWACCPIHGEKSPSFHCEDKKGRYYCFGCGISGSHFQFLKEVGGLSFQQAVVEVARAAGVPLPDAKPMTDEEKRAYAVKMREREEAQKKREAEAAREKQGRVLSAGQIWKQTKPLKGTLAEAYLDWRFPGLAPKDETELRFHPALEINPDHPSGDRWPALIARVSDRNGHGVAIWRIYLARDGAGKMPTKAGGSAKLGYGPAGGGAVRMGGVAKMIGICEGIETGLAIRKLGFTYPIWPCLSTSGIIGFQIPDGVETIVVFPDPDGSKVKFKKLRDGTQTLDVGSPPGEIAFQKFIENNAGRDIRRADGAFDADYLEILQRAHGAPIR